MADEKDPVLDGEPAEQAVKKPRASKKKPEVSEPVATELPELTEETPAAEEAEAAEEPLEEAAQPEETEVPETAVEEEPAPAPKKTERRLFGGRSKKEPEPEEEDEDEEPEAEEESEPERPAVPVKGLSAKQEKTAEAGIRIRLTRSFSGHLKNQVATAHSIGLRKIGDVTIQPDNAQTKGKLDKISHLVEITKLG